MAWWQWGLWGLVIAWLVVLTVCFVAVVMAIAAESYHKRVTIRYRRRTDRLPDLPFEVTASLALGMSRRRIKRWINRPSRKVRGMSRRQAWEAGLHELVLREVERTCRRWRRRPHVPMSQSSYTVLAQLELAYQHPGHQAA